MGRKAQTLNTDRVAQQAWKYIEGYKLREGYAPTIREVAAALPCSYSTALRAVHRLEKYGVLWMDGARAIKLQWHYHIWAQYQREKDRRRARRARFGN